MRYVVSSLLVVALCVAAFAPVRAQQPPQGEATVTLNLESASVTDALKLLFRSTGYNYSLDESVTQGSVTVRLDKIPFTTALRTVLRAANPPLTYRVEGGVYVITPKATETTVEVAETNPVEDITTKMRTEKIVVQHLDSAALAFLFGGSAISLTQSGWSSSSNGYGNGNGNGYGNYGSGGYGGGYGNNNGWGSNSNNNSSWGNNRSSSNWGSSNNSSSNWGGSSFSSNRFGRSY